MHDRIRAGADSVEGCRIGDVTFDQLGIGPVEIGPAPVRQVVERDHLGHRFVAREMVTQVGSDEAGTAGDHDPHGEKGSCWCWS